MVPAQESIQQAAQAVFEPWAENAVVSTLAFEDEEGVAECTAADDRGASQCVREEGGACRDSPSVVVAGQKRGPVEGGILVGHK